MRYFQMFRVTGVANKVTYDGGLKSTETEKKKVVKIHIELEKYANTDDNEIQGWHERAKVFELPEKMFPTELATAVAASLCTNKITEIPVDLEIPVGEAFKIAISCAATDVDMRGAYEYEIIT